MSNKDLLKQAIAEAKTIREAAIANAKEALEESLTPHLKEMLAQKLQEMERDEEDEDENVKNENIYEAEEEEVEAEEGEEAEEEEGNEEEEELDLENMSKEDFKELVLQIVHQDEEGNSEEEIPGEEAPEGEDMTGMDSEEEIDINELLAELAEENELEEGLRDMAKNFGAKVKSGANKVGSAINTALEKAVDAGTPLARKIAEPGAANASVHHGAKNEEVVDESLLQTVVDTLPGITNSQAQMLLGLVGALGFTGVSAALSKVNDLAKMGKYGAGIEKGAKGLEKIGGMAGSVAQQQAFKADAGEQDDAELNEALATVEALRGQLQEVNLLNAKLLYVNKVFKSNNLSEGQKVNVIAAFDKAETVKEVKLVFETVSKNVVAKPAAIREHKSFASKPTGTTTRPSNPEIISEVSETVKRMQKLAGIIK